MALENVEAIYGLTPLQQGILFETLRAPSRNMYVNQLSCRLTGPFDCALLRTAWERAITSNPILRTAFVWDGLEEPVQVVCRNVQAEWRETDLSALPEADQRIRIDAYIEAQRTSGFELARAPLL